MFSRTGGRGRLFALGLFGAAPVGGRLCTLRLFGEAAPVEEVEEVVGMMAMMAMMIVFQVSEMKIVRQNDISRISLHLRFCY